MTALTAGLTPGVKYEGLLDVSANAYSGAGGMLLGRLGVQLADAALRHPRANGREDLIKLGSGFLNARAEPERITAELKLDAGDTGTINGSLRAERTSADWRRLPITGELQVSTSALGFVNLYLPEIDRAAGRLRTDLAVGGSLSAPLLSGTLKLSDGELDLYQVNLRLRGVGLDARMFDNGVTFSGQGRAGEGSLAAKGTLRWSDAQPRGELQISGSNLLVTDVPEARIMASPQLKFAIDGRRIDVSGEVTIPTAKIAPADLTGAVLSSSDETVVGSKPRDPGKAWQITSNVRMLLGDNVQIDTFGLSGRLTGSLTATSDLAGVGRGTGELNVADGKYAALGRRLDITRGRLIFGGGLLADPGIDLRAQKQFPDVLAGVNVRGTLRAPRMTFFSEPSLPQSQIVSLILAGGSLESAQASDKSGATRNEALAQGGAIIAQQLGTRIGIEDVGIEQTLDNSTSLVLGKYLSPRLYISYGISLAESINTVKMRYTLGDRWTIKTEAGKEQSAEFVYTIEK
jgi:translocation and assembly module TamB